MSGKLSVASWTTFVAISDADFPLRLIELSVSDFRDFWPTNNPGKYFARLECNGKQWAGFITLDP